MGSLQSPTGTDSGDAAEVEEEAARRSLMEMKVLAAGSRRWRRPIND